MGIQTWPSFINKVAQLVILWIFFVSLSSCVFFFLHLTGSILLCSPHLTVFFILVYATAPTFGLYSFLTLFSSYFLSECPHFPFSFYLYRSFYFISFSFSLTLSLSFSLSFSLSRSLSPSLFSKLHFAHKLKNSKNRILVKEIFLIFHLAFKKLEWRKKEFGEKQILWLSSNLKSNSLLSRWLVRKSMIRTQHWKLWVWIPHGTSSFPRWSNFLWHLYSICV